MENYIQKCLCIKSHPLLNEAYDVKFKYLRVFAYYCNKCIEDYEYYMELISCYRENFDVKIDLNDNLETIKKSAIELFTWKFQKKKAMYYKLIFIQDLMQYDLKPKEQLLFIIQDFCKLIDCKNMENILEITDVSLLKDVSLDNEKIKENWINTINTIKSKYLKEIILTLFKVIISCLLIWWPLIGLVFVLIYSYRKKMKFIDVCKKIIIGIFKGIVNIVNNVKEYISYSNLENEKIFNIPCLKLINNQFLAHTVTKVLVTANISSGKSTLINALIGKKNSSNFTRNMHI